MSLPSQSTSGRGAFGRALSYRTNRRRRIPLPPAVLLLGAAAVVIVLIVGGIIAFRGDDAPAPTDPRRGLASDTPLPTEPPDDGAGPFDAPRFDPARPISGTLPVGEQRPTRPATPATLPGTSPDTTRPAPGAPAPIATGGSPAGFTTPSARGPAADAVRTSEQRLASGDHVGARRALWDALARPDLTRADVDLLHGRLAELNDTYVFGRTFHPGDPFTMSYEVRSGDAVARIVRAQQLGTGVDLVRRVNQLTNINQIHIGQQLKLVKGPFHAVVRKNAFRLDLYHGDPDRPASWLYVRSFDVGLGADDSTPLGEFRVRNRVENPAWVNPRDRAERYAGGDPTNPIGSHWIGLEGIGDAAVHRAYGLHGTIEPETIGRQASMGCIRLRADDIALLFDLLTPDASVVRITAG